MDGNKHEQNSPQGPQMGPGMPPQGPMGPQGGPNGPMGPMMPPMRPPMSPEKKRKIILGVCLGVGGVVLAIVGVIVAIVLLKVDYGPAYLAAKGLDEKIYDVYQNYDCENAVDYVKSTYRSVEDYAGYVSGCKLATDGVGTLIDELGMTAGVKRDDEIAAQYERFKEAYDAAMPDTSTLGAKLDVYAAWHKFVYLVDDLSYGDADAEFTTAANALINSGNETLKTYGEGWLAKSLEVSHAYTAYDSTSYSDSNRSTLRTTYNDLRSALTEWVAQNKPDILTVVPLEFTETSTMYNEWTKLYDLISETYEQNYNFDSGDCTEFLGEVYCE